MFCKLTFVAKEQEQNKKQSVATDDGKKTCVECQLPRTLVSFIKE